MRPGRDRPVDGALRQLERVRRPVVAVDAVHRPVLALRELGRRYLHVRRGVIDGLPGVVPVRDARDDLPRLVGRDVRDPLGVVDVAAVDPDGAGATSGRPASGRGPSSAAVFFSSSRYFV